MKSSDSFDDELVAKQLKYTGVMETVNIRRQGFALRLPFETFIHRCDGSKTYDVLCGLLLYLL